MKSGRKGERPRHRPQRSCVVCRGKQDKRSLTRIVRREGGLLIDRSGKAEGRGAYLCSTPACWQGAASGTALAHALSVVLNDADRELLLRSSPNS